MKLRDLDGEFLKNNGDGSSERVMTLAEADGVIFQCPLCAVGKDRGARAGKRFVINAHYVICWFVGKVPDDLDPKPGRWNPSGTGLDDLTFVPPGAVSVLMTNPDGCGWHGYVKDGEATER